MADVSLLFDVAGGGSINDESGKLILEQLTEIVNTINSSPLQIKFEADRSSLDAMRTEIREISDSIGSVGSPVSGTGGASLRESAAQTRILVEGTREYGNALSQVNNLLARLNANKKSWTAAEKGESSKRYADLLQQIAALKTLEERLNAGKLTANEFSTAFANIRGVADDASEEIRRVNENQGILNFKTNTEAYAAAMQKLSNLYTTVQLRLKNWTAANADTAASAKQYKTLQAQASALLNLRGSLESGTMSVREFYNELAKITPKVAEASNAIKIVGENKTAVEPLQKNTEEYAEALEKVSKALEQVIGYQNKWTEAKNGDSRISYLTLGSYRTELEGLITSIQDGKVSGEEVEKGLDRITRGVSVQSEQIRAAGENVQSFGHRLTSLSKSLGTWFSSMQIVLYGVRAIRSMISATIELEDAFTQLQIVTGATDAQMKNFSNTAIELAKNLGKSVTDIASSVETFSRLGYNLSDASRLAEYATILSNVAGVGTDEATTGITSIIKGYNLQVSDVEHVADILVEVGQRYAVSASEMMEAFEKSGAALNATNTSIEKSAGLIAAANASVQDASTVGTALKTISARIRGSKTDLEELGENVDDLADGFSKYADEIKALTGFNIMVEGTTNEFKDLYDIMDGIAAVWDNLSDTQQARVSEILGGTRQLQVISSIIGNWGDAASAYTTAMNAAGAATKANDLYMETATAHINQFKAAFQELSSNFAKSVYVTIIVSIGTGLVTVLNALAKIHALLPLIVASIAVIKGYKSAKALAELASKIVVEKAATDTLTASVKGLTAAEKERLIVSIQNAAASKGMSAAETEQILAAYGLTAANKGLKTSNEALAVSFKTVASSIPVLGWVSIVASVAMSVYELVQAFKSSAEDAEDAEDKIRDLESELSELQNTVKTISDDYKNLKSSADDVIPRFVELAKGVNEFGEKVDLTDEEYAEFLELNDKIAEMFPEINLGMGSNGHAMLALSYTADTLSESLYNLVEAQRQASYAEIADTMPKVLNDISAVETAYRGQINQIENVKSEWEDVYNDIVNGTLDTSVGTYAIEAEGLKSAVKQIEKAAALGLHGQIVEQDKSSSNEGYVFSIKWDYENVDTANVKALYDAKLAEQDKLIHDLENKIKKNGHLSIP